jgi:hypothetical protein
MSKKTLERSTLAMALTHSGLVVSGIMLSREVPAVAVGPLTVGYLDPQRHCNLRQFSCSISCNTLNSSCSG